MSLEQIEQSLREAEERHAAAPEAAAALPREAKIEALWGWAEGTQGGCLGCCGERVVKYGEMQGMAAAAGMEPEALRALLGGGWARVRGPRVALPGATAALARVAARGGAVPGDGAPGAARAAAPAA